MGRAGTAPPAVAEAGSEASGHDQQAFVSCSSAGPPTAIGNDRCWTTFTQAAHCANRGRHRSPVRSDLFRFNV